MSETRKDWDDARLEAAFEARARRAGSPPPGFAESIIEGIEPGPARRPMMPWAAAAVGVALVVTLAVAVGVRPGPIVPTSASMTPGSPGTAAPNPTTASLDPLGGPIDVPAALAIRDGSGANDRELAVAGFLSPLPTLACPAIFGPRNPTRIQCPQSFQWLMKDPEITMTASGGGPPRGPALHPSFALVDAPDVPIPASGAFEPVPVVLVGHFHDRRAELCPPDRDGEPKCSDTFVVDRVASVNGEPRGVVTALRNQRFDDATQRQVTEEPVDLVEDVDRLVIDQVPGGSVLSRQLVTIGQVIGIEPILARDNFVPYVSNQATLLWLVTVADQRAEPPVARTFAMFDGSNWFGEVTVNGMRMLERSGSAAPPISSGPHPSDDPTAFDFAPTSILGVPVRDIVTAMGDRRADFNDLGRDEFAIRAWYVAPNPAVGCEDPMAPIHPPAPPCDAARHWLLDDPTQFGTEVGQVRRDPEHWPRALNPILPIDVPFDVPATWAGAAVSPQPVIVLGHFLDNRVDIYAGSNFFVLDALAWTRDGAKRIDTVTRLTSAATEDPMSVLARLSEASPNEALASWATVVDATDFAAFEPRSAQGMPEFGSGAPVWIVRRLIANETDGRGRLAIEWAYTADGGDRVWLTETPDSDPDLATTLDLHDLDPRTDVVRVYDYPQLLTGVRAPRPGETFDWRLVYHDLPAGMAVAPASGAREVAIRWTAGACDKDWRLLIHAYQPPTIHVQPQTYGDFCPETTVRRVIVLVFRDPVDPRAIRTTRPDECCG
ncbi:MAG TPA: hypothetical protein VFJ71_13965 [Candidatus Limnocylindrales bacterium]|nr:hypothetical protein [Candidatus Limnocylindrales bacterium]